MPVTMDQTELGGLFIPEYSNRHGEVFHLLIKRLTDIVIALAGLILFSPVFLAIAIAVRLDSKGPAIFVHKRVGHNGEELQLFKFRSMVFDARERMADFLPEQKIKFEENYKLENDPRVTRVGKLLRKTSLDELPQLVNVLRGELSMVGPRPVVNAELERYGSDKDRFVSVKPGLTGYWQVNGRSDTTYPQRIALELYYIENASLRLDFSIMFKTVWVVFKKAGAK